MREVNNIFTFKLKCLYTFENFLWKLTSKCQSHDYICVKRTCPVLPNIYIICGFLFCCYCCFYCMIVTLTAPLCSSLHIPLTTKWSLLWSWKERLISLFFCQERNPERCKRSPNSKTCKTTYFGCIAVKENGKAGLFASSFLYYAYQMSYRCKNHMLEWNWLLPNNLLPNFPRKIVQIQKTCTQVWQLQYSRWLFLSIFV